VPELSVEPRDSGNETLGLDGPQNRPGFGIDLNDLPVSILTYPERPFGPREPRATAAGRGNRGEHTPGLRIDLLDAILGELKQVLAVERRSRMRGHVECAELLPVAGSNAVSVPPPANQTC
jgi:hypothetical protein